MILNARFPALVRYVPARARKVRAGHVTCFAPVEIPEVPADAMVPVGTLRARDRDRFLPLYAHEGRLWGRLDEGTGFTPASGDGTAEGLAAFVEGRADPQGAESLGRLLSGTPLVAAGEGLRSSRFALAPPSRGEAIELDCARRIEHDGRAAAAAALADWGRANLRLAGGVPYLRREPLAQVACAQEVAGLDVREDPGHTGFRTFVARPATYDACIGLAIRKGCRIAVRGQDVIEGWRALVPDEAVEGADVRRTINAFAGSVRVVLDEMLIWLLRPAVIEQVTTLRDRLLDLEMRALTGTAHLSGEAEALRLMADGLDLHLRLKTGAGSGYGEAHQLAFLREILLPALDARAEADAEAIPMTGPR